MPSTKSLYFAALLATVAATSFAQTPKPAMGASAPAAAMAPADAASKPMHHKTPHKAHHSSKAASGAMAASAAQ